jgi:nicotinamidase-related amidase
MQNFNAISIPETLREIADPKRTALLVYDMQQGIVPHVHEGARVTAAVVSLVDAAHRAGIPVFFSRHYSLPLKHAGLAQLRSAMRFQRASRAQDLRPHLLQGSAEYLLVPELVPGADDIICDKLGMSFFVGTPVEFCLRDLGIVTAVICGCVAEIGIEPTVSHAADLGFLTVTVTDACGSLSATNHEKAMEKLRQASLLADAKDLTEIWRA